MNPYRPLICREAASFLCEVWALVDLYHPALAELRARKKWLERGAALLRKYYELRNEERVASLINDDLLSALPEPWTRIYTLGSDPLASAQGTIESCSTEQGVFSHYIDARRPEIEDPLAYAMRIKSVLQELTKDDTACIDLRFEHPVDYSVAVTHLLPLLETTCELEDEQDALVSVSRIQGGYTEDSDCIYRNVKVRSKIHRPFHISSRSINFPPFTFTHAEVQSLLEKKYSCTVVLKLNVLSGLQLRVQLAFLANNRKLRLKLGQSVQPTIELLPWHIKYGNLCFYMNTTYLEHGSTPERELYNLPVAPSLQKVQDEHFEWALALRKLRNALVTFSPPVTPYRDEVWRELSALSNKTLHEDFRPSSERLTAALVATHDSHIFVHSPSKPAQRYLPVLISTIENAPIIAAVSSATDESIVGSVVKSINGVEVEELIERYAKSRPWSTRQRLLYNALHWQGILSALGEVNTYSIEMFHKDTCRHLNFECTEATPVLRKKQIEACWTRDNITYLDCSRVTGIKKLQDTWNAESMLILDMRDAWCFSFSELFPHLISEPVNAPRGIVMCSIPPVLDCGCAPLPLPSSQENVDIIFPAGIHPRPRAVLAIIDATVMSSGEYFLQCCKSLPSFMTVGETTGGANGNLTPVSMPADHTVYMSCMSCVDADGHDVQGKGMTPDVRVSPTQESVTVGDDVLLEAALAEAARWNYPAGSAS